MPDAIVYLFSSDVIIAMLYDVHLLVQGCRFNVY